MSANYYLRQNVQIEPLYNQWHAHPLVIAPASAAMFQSFSHLAIMQSYVQMPMAHVAALKNPDMVGGPFIDYGGKRISEIKALKTETEQQATAGITLAKDIRALHELLKTQADGRPMQEIYDTMPESLKGFVELTYDLENQPRIRFIEPLLYASEYYNSGGQSIALTLINSDDRPFIFSTPRLSDNHILKLPFAFNDSRIDRIAGLKWQPAPLPEIKELLNVNGEQEELLMTLLTEETPAKAGRYTGEGVRIRYFGHACVLFETKNVSILSDALISYKYETALPRFTYEDLPEKIDYVMITHNHHDHIVIETLLQLRSRIGNIIVPRNNGGSLQDPSMKLILENIGFSNVIELDDLQAVKNDKVTITAIPFYGEHCDLDIRSKAAYHIRLYDKSFMVCADSNSMSKAVYQNVRKLVGKIDMLFIGLECTGAPMSWAYGALFPRPVDRQLDQVRRSNGSNSQTALDMIDIFEPQHVFLYAMGLEPWLNYFMALQHGHQEGSEEEINKVMSAAGERNITVEKLYCLRELEV